MQDLIAILIAVVSTVFVVLLFRSLFQLLSLKSSEDKATPENLKKIFMPTIIWAILMILFFVFVVPNY